jgi:hypothetical protein
MGFVQLQSERLRSIANSTKTVAGNNLLPVIADLESLNSAITNPTGGVYVLPVYSNNAGAIAGGLKVGNLYRTNADPDFIAVVH